MSRSKRKSKPLRERLAWPSVLYRAFAEVTSGANPDSAGPDGVTIESFRKSAKSEIARLRLEIKTGKYSHSRGRGVALSKKAGLPVTRKTVRPITVFNVRDRIIQRAVSNLIWPHLRDRVFSEVSFGGIRAYSVPYGKTKSCSNVRKNVEAAARRILELRRDGYGLTFETDIQRFFPSVNKQVLLSELRSSLPDDTLHDLLESSIETDVTNLDALEARGLSECWDPLVGVPQGGVLSPLLANFYLSRFDKEIMDAGFQMIRYVDDLVVLTKTAEAAEHAYEFVKCKLSAIGLTIHELNQSNEKGKVKTRIVKFNQSFEFLGLTFNKFTVHPSESKRADLKDRVRHVTHAWNGANTLIEAVLRLNRLLRGWMSAYTFCDIPADLLTQIDHLAGTGLASWMKYHKMIRNENALTPTMLRKIGLWTVKEASIRPLSRSLRSQVVVSQ
jgi:RNA-directed DNA polymerase